MGFLILIEKCKFSILTKFKEIESINKAAASRNYVNINFIG